MKLKIYFYGMVAFVPDTDLPNPTRMRAILGDATDPANGPDGSVKHSPKVVYRDRGSWKTVDLKREEIDIANLDNPPSLSLRREPPQTSVKPSVVSIDRFSIWWIAEMAKINRNAATLAPNVLALPGDGVNQNVAARIKIGAGEFRVDDLSRYDGSFFSWSFLPTPPAHALYEQALAIKVLWEVPVIGTTAKLKLTSLDDSTSVKRVSIPADDSGDAEVVIGNLSKEGEDSIFSEEAEAGQFIDTDLDFRWYYRLSATLPNEKPMPVPEASAQGKRSKALGIGGKYVATALGGGPVRCPQLFFAPNGNA